MTEPTLAEWLLEAIAEDEALIGPAASDAFHGQPGALFQWGHEVDVNFPRLAAECEAKRRIVELHADGRAELRYPGDDLDDEIAGMPAWCVRCKVDHQGERWPCETLRLLAAPYSGRPGFREEWRP